MTSEAAFSALQRLAVDPRACARACSGGLALAFIAALESDDAQHVRALAALKVLSTHDDKLQARPEYAASAPASSVLGPLQQNGQQPNPIRLQRLALSVLAHLVSRSTAYTTSARLAILRPLCHYLQQAAIPAQARVQADALLSRLVDGQSALPSADAHVLYELAACGLERAPATLRLIASSPSSAIQAGVLVPLLWQDAAPTGLEALVRLLPLERPAASLSKSSLSQESLCSTFVKNGGVRALLRLYMDCVASSRRAEMALTLLLGRGYGLRELIVECGAVHAPDEVDVPPAAVEDGGKLAAAVALALSGARRCKGGCGRLVHMVGAWWDCANGRCLDTQKQNSEKWYPIWYPKAAQRKMGRRMLAAFSMRDAHAAAPLTPAAFEAEVTKCIVYGKRVIDAAATGSGVYVCNGALESFEAQPSEAFNRVVYAKNPVITLPSGTKVTVRDAIEKYRAYFVMICKTRHAAVANAGEKALHVLIKAERLGQSSLDETLWTAAGAGGVHGFDRMFGVAVLIWPNLLDLERRGVLKLNLDRSRTIPLTQVLIDNCRSEAFGRAPHVRHPVEIRRRAEVARNGEGTIDFAFTLPSPPLPEAEVIVACIDFEAQTLAGVPLPLLNAFEVGVAAVRRRPDGSWERLADFHSLVHHGPLSAGYREQFVHAPTDAALAAAPVAADVARLLLAHLDGLRGGSGAPIIIAAHNLAFDGPILYRLLVHTDEQPNAQLRRVGVESLLCTLALSGRVGLKELVKASLTTTQNAAYTAMAHTALADATALMQVMTTDEFASRLATPTLLASSMRSIDSVQLVLFNSIVSATLDTLGTDMLATAIAACVNDERAYARLSKPGQGPNSGKTKLLDVVIIGSKFVMQRHSWEGGLPGALISTPLAIAEAAAEADTLAESAVLRILANKKRGYSRDGMAAATTTAASASTSGAASGSGGSSGAKRKRGN